MQAKEEKEHYEQKNKDKKMNQHHSTTIIISFKNDFNKNFKKNNTTKKTTIANVFLAVKRNKLNEHFIQCQKQQNIKKEKANCKSLTKNKTGKLK